MMDPVDRLMAAMDEYADARAELKKCQAEAGYEAGYFCQRYRDALDRVRDDLKQAFRDAVRAATDTGEG